MNDSMKKRSASIVMILAHGLFAWKRSLFFASGLRFAMLKASERHHSIRRVSFWLFKFLKITRSLRRLPRLRPPASLLRNQQAELLWLRQKSLSLNALSVIDTIVFRRVFPIITNLDSISCFAFCALSFVSHTLDLEFVEIRSSATAAHRFCINNSCRLYRVLLGLLVTTQSSHATMASHSDITVWASTLLSLQQRDCAGLTPTSLLAPSTGDQIGGKSTKIFVLVIMLISRKIQVQNPHY